MNLIIVPGAGEPCNKKYKSVYKLIEDEANKRDYKSIATLSFIGHSTNPVKAPLTLLPNVLILKNTIKKFTDLNQKFDIVCRSYGCSVFFELYRLYPDFLSGLNRAVLWGPSPYHNFYNFFRLKLEEFNKNGAEKGVLFSEDTFKTMYPFELHIEGYNDDLNLTIATGSLDEISKKEFISYLKINYPDKNIKYKIIEGVGHSVNEKNEEYLKMLFQ